MNEQITSAAELDALPILCRTCGGKVVQPVDCARCARINAEWSVALSKPQRVQPSREDVVAALKGVWFNLSDEFLGRFADAALALFAQQPTVAEVKAGALREFSGELRAYGSQSPTPHFDASFADLLDARADRIEREARP